MKQTRTGYISEITETRGAPDGYLRQEQFQGRRKRRLARHLGIGQFGVNHTMLEPGAFSALRHWHEAEER